MTGAGTSLEVLAGIKEKLLKKADGSFTNFEDFVSLPSSKYIPTESLFPNEFKNIFVLGIGGSSLGTKVVYKALRYCKLPKMYFFENVDRQRIDEALEGSTNEAFVVISKSGNTLETQKNLDYLTSQKYKNLIRGDNTFVVSLEGSKAWEWGKKLGAKLYSIPEIVSGRFQVFGPVCAVPLALLGIKIEKFIGGAKKSLALIDTYGDEALKRFKLYREGIDSDVYFAFDERLRGLADWYASITAESLGKNGGGITPVVSVGSRDLHSIGQLYLQGPKDKFTTFLTLSDTDKDNLCILEAVKKAYDDAKLSYTHTVLNAQDTETLTADLGAFMQSKILETVFLGELMGINPYDQPGVQLYKKYLSSK